MDLALDQLCNSDPDESALLALFKDLEFKTWINELESDRSAPSKSAPVSSSDNSDSADPAGQDPEPPVDKNYQTVLTQDQLDNWVAKIKSAPLVALDTETTSLDYMQAKIVGVSFAIEAGQAAYVPLAHDYLGAPPQLDRDAVLAQLQPLLEDEKLAKKKKKKEKRPKHKASQNMNLGALAPELSRS